MTESTSEYKKRIEEIKQSIENEPYMAKMREDIAEGISKTGIRQATVEEHFQAVIDETTDKDVISAPEIIVARGGAQTLGERLDKSDERTEIVELGVRKAMKSNFLKQQGLLVAHRGLMNLAPENSAIAFELAGKYGFWGIETDCHETTDGEFYLYHDADLSSQTNKTGKVYEMTSEELKDVVYTTAKGSTNYPNTPLCTLDEYLSIASKYNMFCFLEIGMVKNHQGILDKIREYNMEGNVLINTNEYLVKTYRRLDAFIPIGWVTWKKITDADIDFCVENRVDMIGLAVSDGSVSSNKNRDLVNKCHENDLIVSMYIVNKYSDYNWCKNNFVDVITTDHIVGGV